MALITRAALVEIDLSPGRNPMFMMNEPELLGRAAVRRAQCETRKFVVPFESPINNDARQPQGLMPVAHDHRIKLPANLCLTLSNLEGPTHNRSEASNDAIAPLNSQAISVREEEPVIVYTEVGIALSRDVEGQALVFAEVALQIAIDVPLVAGIDATLHPGLARSSAMIAHDTGDEDAAERVRHSLQRTSE